MADLQVDSGLLSPLEMERSISGAVAVTACTAMAFSYVAILYAPTFILRLPPPISLNIYMIRRFICATIASIGSLIVCFLILSIRRSWEGSSILGIYGIRVDHLWQALVIPFSLTSLLYAGSMFWKSSLLVETWKENECDSEAMPTECVKIASRRSLDRIYSIASNVLAWRNYAVAPITEELVFRACMIPLLLCGGFKTNSIIFFSPIFFSLGLQLGYTVIFGWYASFLFIRTGHLIAPLAAHIFCNVMGLPLFSSPRRKVATSIAFAAGFASFAVLLFPATHPDLYNDKTENCNCWHGYCGWK